MFPGCLIAGVGLGLTNTPVTNTTTASVPTTRAGMASGIDMSARLISLAVNIAMMGVVLVNGILSHLQNAVPGSVLASQLRSLAEKIAVGDIVVVGQSSTEQVLRSGEVAHAALVHGFGSVMLYGGTGVWLLAAASFIIFGGKNRTLSEGQIQSHLAPNRAGSEQECL
jgi:hypothetical protein